jgi:hypothetical protein
MEEGCKQGICYYCDEKYSPCHKCCEKKFFQIDVSSSTSSEDILSDEAIELEETPPIVPIPDLVTPPMELEEPIISLHALKGISTLHTLKINGYIKHRSVVVLIDIDNTHNFVHHWVTEEVNCFVRPISNFQILITNGGTMKCGGYYENVKLQMGD